MRASPLPWTVYLAFLGVAVACGGEPEKIDLKVNLEAGQSYGIKMLSDQSVTQTIEGTPQKMDQKLGMAYTFAVEEVDDDGNALVKVTYEWTFFEQGTPFGKITYDSDNPPAKVDPMTQGFAVLVGKRLSMIISPTGEVLEVRGVDALISEIVKEMDLPDDPTAPDAEKQLKEQFGNEAVKEMMKSMWVAAAQAVGEGDSWKNKITISRGFPMVLENTYTLKDRDDGLATVDVQSTIGPNPDAPPIQMGPMSMRYDISGTQSGSMVVREDSGMTLRATMTQKMSGKVQLVGPDVGPDASAWPISMESKTTIEPYAKKPQPK